MLTFQMIFYLLFSNPDRVIDFEVHAKDNQVPKDSKHKKDSIHVISTFE